MTYSEATLWFDCAGDSLLGILARPHSPAPTGIIVVVGGPQYRVGSHRQFVLLSRSLAAAGFPVLRFDYRGMGDSGGLPRDFQEVSVDLGAAIDAMQQALPEVKNIVLWGLCDGASAALLYCHQSGDRRVRSLFLINPWVRSEASMARTRVKHYYLQRLLQGQFWSKLLQGGIGCGALTGLTRAVRAGARSAVRPATPGFQHRMAAAWDAFEGRIVLLLSGADYTAREFLDVLHTDPAWRKALAHPGLIRHDLPGADHTLSGTASRIQAEQWTLAAALEPGP